MTERKAIEQAAVEAAARAVWDQHYSYGPGSIGSASAKPWDKVDGQSRREYLADAQAAIAAYLATMREAGFVMVPVEPTEAMLGVIESHHRVRVAAVYRAMIAASD